MSFLGGSSMPAAPPPPPPPPNPASVASPSVANAGAQSQARLAAAAGAGFDNTITNIGGAQGVDQAAPLKQTLGGA